MTTPITAGAEAGPEAAESSHACPGNEGICEADHTIANAAAAPRDWPEALASSQIRQDPPVLQT